MTVVYLLGAFVGVALVWMATGVWRIGAISKGEPIGERPNTALLLIDLQAVFWDHGPYAEPSKSKAEAVIHDEITAAKRQGIPVIAVRQEWSIPSTKMLARLTMKGAALEGTRGTELAAPFAKMAERVVVKRVQDAFETGELDTLLAKLDVGRLRIVGLDFNYCVQKTALAARNRGYQVTVVRHGTLASGPTDQAVERMTSQQIALE